LRQYEPHSLHLAGLQLQQRWRAQMMARVDFVQVDIDPYAQMIAQDVALNWVVGVSRLVMSLVSLSGSATEFSLHVFGMP
jgi:hypothetical protein